MSWQKDILKQKIKYSKRNNDGISRVVVEKFNYSPSPKNWQVNIFGKFGSKNYKVKSYTGITKIEANKKAMSYINKYMG